MKFKFNGIIWDKDKNAALCESKEGVFETDNKEIIEKLIALGYKGEGLPIVNKLEEAKKEIAGKKKK